MGTTIEVVCAICQDDSQKLYQCCPNIEDSMCESCWSAMIDIIIKKGKIGSVFNNELLCDYCHQSIERNHLPNKIQKQLENILLTIPKTKNPKLIEDFNYSYNESKELRHCLTDDKFIFLSQRHYNLLGNCLDTYIQLLMKNTPWNYNEIWLPIKDENINDHHDQVNIFTSNDFQTNENGCLILIQGSGVVRPGQWARSCCINESLDIGAMFPYMAKAKEHNLSVIILNPNQTGYIEKKSNDTDNVTSVDTTVNETDTSMKESTSNNEQKPDDNPDITTGMNMEEGVSNNEQKPADNPDITTGVNMEEGASTEEKPSNNEENSLNDDLISFYLSSFPLLRPLTKKIPNLSTNREHVLYVYDHIISKCPAKQFYIVAHSAGGDGLMYLLRKRQDHILPTLAKIAFTDSVHSILPLESKEIKNFLKANAIHFVASDEPMGTAIDYIYDFSQKPACQEVSAGHPKHEYTSGYCVDGVFQFFFPLESIEKTKL